MPRRFIVSGIYCMYRTKKWLTPDSEVGGDPMWWRVSADCIQWCTLEFSICWLLFNNMEWIMESYEETFSYLMITANFLLQNQKWIWFLHHHYLLVVSQVLPWWHTVFGCWCTFDVRRWPSAKSILARFMIVTRLWSGWLFLRNCLG